MKLRPALTKRKGPFAAPTFFAAGANNSGTGVVTYALPASFAADDIHLLIIEIQGTETLSVPAGWAHVTGSPVAHGDSTTILNVLWRRAQGGDTDQLVADPGDHQVGVIIGIRGCRPSGDPWDAIGTGTLSATATPSIPGITAPNNDSLVVVINCNGTDDTGDNYSSWANATLSSFTERSSPGTIANNGGSFSVATGTLASAGSTGTSTVTIDFSTTSVYMVLAFSGHPVP